MNKHEVYKDFASNTLAYLNDGGNCKFWVTGNNLESVCTKECRSPTSWRFYYGDTGTFRISFPSDDKVCRQWSTVENASANPEFWGLRQHLWYSENPWTVTKNNIREFSDRLTEREEPERAHSSGVW